MRGLVAVVLWMPMLAMAGTTVEVDSMIVNDMPMQDIRCDLTVGGLFASMAVAGEIASQKEAFDACVPSGAAATLTWEWSGGATHNVVVVKTSHEPSKRCVQEAMAAVQSQQSGTCRATLLFGDTPTAEQAYIQLNQPTYIPLPDEELSETK